MSKLDNAIGKLKFDANGLIPAICVDHENKQILQVAYMNAESFGKTLETGKATFFSRSRQKLWVKGEQSGHTQTIKTIYLDCDGDALVVEVSQIGGACHMGYRSCFFRELADDGQWEVIAEKVFDPDEVYKSKG